MPNFDAGHYFLTALLPIDNRSLARDNRTLSSPVRIVRRALSVLPKAVQSPATPIRHHFSHFDPRQRRPAWQSSSYWQAAFSLPGPGKLQSLTTNGLY